MVPLVLNIGIQEILQKENGWYIKIPEYVARYLKKEKIRYVEVFLKPIELEEEVIMKD